MRLPFPLQNHSTLEFQDESIYFRFLLPEVTNDKSKNVLTRSGKALHSFESELSYLYHLVFWYDIYISFYIIVMIAS